MSNIIVEKYDQAAVVKINRAKVLNALNRETLEELFSIIEGGKKNGIKALILTGEGEKAFIAGADIKEMHALSHLGMLDFCKLGQSVANALSDAPFLTIAAVNGYALGGGLEMALACDFIYASSSARLGLPEVSLGIIPGFGGTQRLASAVGIRQAKEMIMSGLIITAERARELGIVNHVSRPENLLSDSLAAAGKILSHPYSATFQAKNAINAGFNLGMKEALELERNICAVCFATPECNDGMEKFLTSKGNA